MCSGLFSNVFNNVPHQVPDASLEEIPEDDQNGNNVANAGDAAQFIPVFDPAVVQVSGPEDKDWVISDPPVQIQSKCVACGKVECDEEVECVDKYLKMMEESDDSTYTTDDKVQLLKLIFCLINFLNNCLPRMTSEVPNKISCEHKISDQDYTYPQVDTAPPLSYFIFVWFLFIIVTCPPLVR